MSNGHISSSFIFHISENKEREGATGGAETKTEKKGEADTEEGQKKTEKKGEAVTEEGQTNAIKGNVS